MNHAMTAVGYGKEEGREFAILRNSWGKGWGEDGYVKVEMKQGDKKGGTCSMYKTATIPIMEWEVDRKSVV